MNPYTYCPRCSTPLASVNQGGTPRMSCPRAGCGFVHWDNPIPVVGAVVEHPEGVVLVQSIGWPSSWYGLVTGFLEKGEKPEEGILREVKEETGLEAELGEWIGFYPFRRMNQLIMVYHVRVQGEVVIDQTELADFRIVPLSQLRPWKAATGYALSDWLKTRGFTPEFVELPG